MAFYRPNNKWKNNSRGADSKWEGTLRDTVLKDCEFHPSKIDYFIEHKYTPDFKIGNTLIEAKGRFMDSAEARKYIWIRKSITPGLELVFLFYNHKTPMPHAKARKDGTKRTHGDWADKNHFRWFTKETIKEILIINK